MYEKVFDYRSYISNDSKPRATKSKKSATIFYPKTTKRYKKTLKSDLNVIHKRLPL